MKGYGVLIGLAVGLCTPLLGQTASPYQAVQQGNVLYQEKRYDEALQQYEAASQAMPEAAEILFNQGNVHYQQGNYVQALALYASALHAGNRQLESRITYNLGNVAYQQALQTLQNSQDALKHLRSAMTYYRNSLQLDPQQQQARYNLELAMRLRHQLLEQERQQSVEPSEKRQKTEHQGQQASNREQEAQSQETDDQQSQGQSANQASSVHASPTSGSVGTQKVAAPPKLSPEEAQRRLDVIRQRAREIDQLRQQWRRARMRDVRMDKYW